VRDTKQRGGGTLVIGVDRFHDFLGAVKDDAFRA